MAAKRFTTEVDTDVFTRLKTQAALTGVAVKRLVNKYLDEALPPLPPSRRLRESEATS